MIAHDKHYPGANRETRQSMISALVWVWTLIMLSPFVGDSAVATGNGVAHGDLGPDGYRMAHYRAPTPESVPHGTTLGTVDLERLLASEGAALVDVQAVVVRPESAEFGFAWLPSAPRYNLPGSTWLPNVGYGQLEPAMDAYFRENLERITGERFDHPLVFYCVADCWMSWNAVQRAYEYGYRMLYWYRGGTDAWAAAGLPLVEDQPEPLDDMPAID